METKKEKKKLNIKDLPTEILIKCFSYLDLDMEAVGQLLRVCKTFKNVLESDYARPIYQNIITNYPKTFFLKNSNNQPLTLQQAVLTLPSGNVHHAITIFNEAEKITKKKKSVDSSIESINYAMTEFGIFPPKLYKVIVAFSICYLYYSYQQNDMRGMFKAFALLSPGITNMIHFYRRYSLGDSAAYHSKRIEMLEDKKAKLMTLIDIESNSNNPDTAPKKNN